MTDSIRDAAQARTYHALCAWLTREGVAYRTLHHAPTFTSEDSARVRGEAIRIGGKALVLKVGEDFRLFVVSAARKIDSAALKTHFTVKKIRFASAAELLQLTGLVPGCVPPFGKPFLPFEVFVDSSILDNAEIAFNAGSLSNSIILSVADYLRVAKPVIVPFSARP